MSHYAHPNLSLVTQINVQNAFRAFSFLAETSVFAYLGSRETYFHQIYAKNLTYLSSKYCKNSKLYTYVLEYFHKYKFLVVLQYPHGPCDMGLDHADTSLNGQTLRIFFEKL